MAFKKKLASKTTEVLNDTEHFSKGERFSLDRKTWIVTELEYGDNTPMRRIVADDGTEEIVSLSTLQRDQEHGDLIIISDVQEDDQEDEPETKTEDV